MQLKRQLEHRTIKRRKRNRKIELCQCVSLGQAFYPPLCNSSYAPTKPNKKMKENSRKIYSREKNVKQIQLFTISEHRRLAGHYQARKNKNFLQHTLLGL